MVDLIAAPCHNPFIGGIELKKAWLKTRLEFHLDIKAQVSRLIGRQTRSLRASIAQYEKEFSRRWKASSYAQLLRQVHRANIVLGADFHAFSQSQRIHLRIMRQIEVSKEVVVCLEAFKAEDQVWLDKYMNLEISEDVFLDQICWDKNWGFPFENYRPLLELARVRKWQVIGININRKSMKLRDQFMATQIVRSIHNSPRHLQYVVVGDLHLAEAHLPRELEKVGVWEKKKSISIFQNSEHLYFKLARKNLEHQVEVLSSSQNQYCVIGSPPWVKWQNYLNFLEQNADFDIGRDGEMSWDPTDSVAQFIQMLSQDLKLSSAIDDFTVWTLNDQKKMLKLQKDLSAKEQKRLRDFIQAGRSFYLPKHHMGFLSQTSVNHAATLAGFKILSDAYPFPVLKAQFPRDFETMIWIEAIGFFCSRLVNHKRKAETLEQLRKKLLYSDRKPHTAAVLRLALSQRLAEISGQKVRNLPKSSQVQIYLDAAQIVGHMLGGRIYDQVMDGRLAIETVRDWMSSSGQQKIWDKFYNSVIDTVEKKKHRGKKTNKVKKAEF